MKEGSQQDWSTEERDSSIGDGGRINWSDDVLAVFFCFIFSRPNHWFEKRLSFSLSCVRIVTIAT